MTSYERVMAVLNGERPDRIPVFPLVSQWCVRQTGFFVYDAIVNVEKYVYAQYDCLRKFGYDMVRDLAGIHCESEAMGSKLNFPKDAFPSVSEFAIKDFPNDLRNLRVPDPYKDGHMPIVLEGVRRLKKLCEGETPVMAYLQAPFRHASMLRGPDKILRDVYKNPKMVQELLELCVVTQIVWGTALVHAGADILFISDPMASGDMISPKIWMTFAQPYTTRVVSALKRLGIRMIMHICGDTSDRLQSMADTGVDCLSLDQKVNMAEARKILGDRIALMGNLDPSGMIMLGSAEQVEEEGLNLLCSASGTRRNYILSSGCGVPIGSPPENIRAMVCAAKKFELPPQA
jgi:uroporphyrinogen decarboxylase